MQVSKLKLSRMEILAFKNGLRLHNDAIRLFNSKSYPSAYFLSVLALEEFGKAEALSYFLFYWANSPFTEQELQDWFSELYRHPFKHRAFYRDRVPRGSLKRMKTAWDKVGMIELLKQNSVYVGLPKNRRLINLRGKINSPFGVKREKAAKQITVVNDYLIGLALGHIHKYMGVDNEGIQRLLNRPFLAKLNRVWKLKGWEMKKEIIKIEKWAAAGYK